MAWGKRRKMLEILLDEELNLEEKVEELAQKIVTKFKFKFKFYIIQKKRKEKISMWKNSVGYLLNTL